MARLASKSKKFVDRSRRVSRATKDRKSPRPAFGTSSQFRGVGRGKSGDPRS